MDNLYIENEQIIGFDVDDTLILYKPIEDNDETVIVIDPYDGVERKFVVHRPHIKLMTDRQARGCQIIVWSQGGPQWAKAVVDALGIDGVIIMAKPFMIVDDLPATAWLSNRTYIDPKSKYGTI